MTTIQNSNSYLNPTIDILKCPLDYTDNGTECLSNLKPGYIEIFKSVACPPNSTEEPYDGPYPHLKDVLKRCKLNNGITVKADFKKCAIGYVPNKDNIRCTKPCNNGYEQIGEKCALLCKPTEKRDGETCISANANADADANANAAADAAASRKKKIIIGISSIGLITIIGISIFLIIKFHKK